MPCRSGTWQDSLQPARSLALASAVAWHLDQRAFLVFLALAAGSILYVDAGYHSMGM